GGSSRASSLTGAGSGLRTSARGDRLQPQILADAEDQLDGDPGEDEDEGDPEVFVDGGPTVLLHQGLIELRGGVHAGDRAAAVPVVVVDAEVGGDLLEVGLIDLRDARVAVLVSDVFAL